MNRVFLNSKQIASFDNQEDAVYFIGQVVKNEEVEHPYVDGEDIAEVELDEEGIVEISLSDISIDGVILK